MESYLYYEIMPVHCWDTFGSQLNISALPSGLYFVNNTLYGEINYGQELKPYKVVSSRDVESPFILYIGGMEERRKLKCSICFPYNDLDRR